MLYYQDLVLKTNPEFTAHELMSVLYEQLHKVLWNLKINRVGVSFPKYSESKRDLGNCLRLFGQKEDLSTLMGRGFLASLRDDVEVGAVAEVPTNAVHRTLRRAQAKSNPERLRRRQIRRHGLTAAEAAERVPDSSRELLNLPFCSIRSGSTGQRFRLYLRLSPEPEAATSGSFNSYGISATATIPWF